MDFARHQLLAGAVLAQDQNIGVGGGGTGGWRAKTLSMAGEVPIMSGPPWVAAASPRLTLAQLGRFPPSNA